jgi:hypothetical protein
VATGFQQLAYAAFHLITAEVTEAVLTGNVRTHVFTEFHGHLLLEYEFVRLLTVAQSLWCSDVVNDDAPCRQTALKASAWDAALSHNSVTT